MDLLKDYLNRKFGIDDETFLKVLAMSPSAEGYLQGSISEFLFMQYAKQKRYEIHRIKEKPEGGYNAKNSEARGDFYIRKIGEVKNEWYVIENKGIKTNTEKQLFDLTNKDKLFKHLKSLAFPKEDYLIKSYEKGYIAYERAKLSWETNNPGKTFPNFKWNKETPGARNFNLVGIWETPEKLREWVDSLDENTLTFDSYLNLKGPVRMLATHAPNNRKAPITQIKQAMPLVNDFSIMCVDLFQRTGKHEFVFMNPLTISHSPTSPEHLYQNYHIDYIIPGIKDNLNIKHPWYLDLDECIEKTNPPKRELDKSQLDSR